MTTTTITKKTTSNRETEVSAKATRRTFTKEYKLEILEKADRCSSPGEIGELLRREGLFSSHLAAWRAQRREGVLKSMGRKRGPKAKQTAEQVELEKLRRENQRLRKKLDHAEKIITIQKKLSEVLGIPLDNDEVDEPN
jgi:transposase